MKTRIFDLRKILILLALLVFGFLLVWKLWGADYYLRIKENRRSEELAKIYDSTMTYPDPVITEIYLSAQEIEDAEAIYHSLWFLDAAEDGKDDVFIAVFAKENNDMNIYLSYANSYGDYDLSWEKKSVKVSEEPLTTLLPRQVSDRKNYASYAVRCDGITVFE